MAKAKKLTIKGIAAEAGVSITTASFVINGNDERYGIKKATVDKVREVIAKHRYQPNFGAQIMKTGKSHTVAFLAPSITDGFYNRIVVELEKAAMEYGYKLILGNTLDSVSTEAAYIENLIHRQIDGVVVVPVDPKAKHLKWLKENDIPSVLFQDPTLSQPGFFCVDFDLNVGMEQAVTHLKKQGCKKIALLEWRPASDEESAWIRLREGLLATYLKCVGKGSRRVGGKELVWPLFGETVSPEDGVTLLSLIAEHKPDALIAMRSDQILGAWRYLAQAGVQVPEDIRLVGCDDKSANRNWYPSISGVSAPKEEIGRYMLEQIVMKKRSRGGKLFPVELQVRESSS